ncbi:MAG: hypothetical protein R3E89_09500 [Thiolinea sp.]
MPDLSPFQVSELAKHFSNELDEWRRLFGEETAQALWQTQLAGHPAVLRDLAFWEQRIREHGLPGDYFGFQDALNGLYPERCHEVRDEMLQRFGDSRPRRAGAVRQGATQQGLDVGEQAQ